MVACVLTGWRVCRVVAFNVAYIGTEFIYLSRAKIELQPSEALNGF